MAKHIGLLNTMVFTHVPANICLILAALSPNLPVALGLLLLRAALSQMDVPTRSAYVMAVVTPPERAAAASFTTVPRSLAAAISPSLGGALFAAGWLAAPLVACGLLKITYDLALLFAFGATGPWALIAPRRLLFVTLHDTDAIAVVSNTGFVRCQHC